VLIYGEGGAGDQIQFIRYIPLLKQRFNCRVILNCTASLGLLFSELDFVDEIVYKEHVSRDHKPDCDYHFPLMSLPLYLKQWEPVWTGSLFNTHRRKPRLDTEKTKVGFVFTPNPNTFEAPDNVVNVAWINHCNIPGVQFYNLHHKDRANLPGVIDLCDQIENFADLADYVNVMDVIVGIDSAILHLAGALQKKAFGLIRKNANWRWGTAERTPWYPTVRLIRQKIQGDWGTAIDDLCRYLSNTSMSNGLEK
jgi:ADP-heptose:LPS heptosyltransferase